MHSAQRRSTPFAVLGFAILVGFLAVNFLSVLMAILLPVDTLSGEIDSGVMQTLASNISGRSENCAGSSTRLISPGASEIDCVQSPRRRRTSVA